MYILYAHNHKKQELKPQNTRLRHELCLCVCECVYMYTYADTLKQKQIQNPLTPDYVTSTLCAWVWCACVVWMYCAFVHIIVCKHTKTKTNSKRPNTRISLSLPTFEFESELSSHPRTPRLCHEVHNFLISTTSIRRWWWRVDVATTNTKMPPRTPRCCHELHTLSRTTHFFRFRQRPWRWAGRVVVATTNSSLWDSCRRPVYIYIYIYMYLYIHIYTYIYAYIYIYLLNRAHDIEERATFAKFHHNP